MMEGVSAGPNQTQVTVITGAEGGGEIGGIPEGDLFTEMDPVVGEDRVDAVIGVRTRPTEV